MELGVRMKAYEAVSKGSLMARTPVIIRIDGKAFHTYTRDMEKPFSHELHNAMVQTAKYLVENIQGAKLAYTQSDEISILVTDWESLNTQSWFNYNIAKVVSVSASMATGIFNRSLSTERPVALFDSRAFNVPLHEVNNYFIWRQQDASRNSVQMLARAYFSHNELHKKSNDEIQDMLMLQHGVNWNDLDTWKKRGTCVKSVLVPYNDTHRTKFIIDEEIPIFTQDRDYINRYCVGV